MKQKNWKESARRWFFGLAESFRQKYTPLIDKYRVPAMALYERLQENVLFRFVQGFVQRYFEHNVNVSAAALAYFLVFSIFPLIILFCGLFNLFHLTDLPGKMLYSVVPPDIQRLLNYYISYVQSNSSLMMTLFGAVFSIYFPYRAVNALMLSINTAYGTKETRSSIVRGLLAIGLTFGLLLSVLLSLAAISIGGRTIEFLLQYIRFPHLAFAMNLWRLFRFVLMALVSYLTIGLFYLAAPCAKVRIRDSLPGAVLALTAWVVLSVGFSIYVEYFSTSSVFYGYLSIVIILLTWLYFTANILILGAEFNSYLADWKRQNPK